MGPLKSVIILFACSVATTGAVELHPLSNSYIDLINSKQSTWKAGRNFPHNTPLKYLKNLLGVIPNESDYSLPRITHDADVIANLPENFDAREKWPNCPSIREIRDQGACGSCWAVAAAEVMTDRVCTYSNGTEQFHFSAEDLLSCCTDCGDRCHGGSSTSAWEYWINEGIVSGGNYNSSQGCRSYSIPPCVHHAPGHNVNNSGNLMPCLENSPYNPKCLSTCDKNYGVDYVEDKRYGVNASGIYEDEGHIKAELFLNGPVQAQFKVFLDFYNYKTGIYLPTEDPEDFLGYHSVKIIGWGIENGVKYWLVANSWNLVWGENGFFKIGRGSNVCGIEEFIIAGIPLLTKL